MKKIIVCITIFLAIFSRADNRLLADTASGEGPGLETSFLSKPIIINKAVFKGILSQENNGVLTSLEKMNALDLSQKIISQEEFYFKAKKFLKQNELEKAADAYAHIKNKTNESGALLKQIVDLTFLNLDLYFENADFNNVKKLGEMLSNIAPENAEVYVYLGAVELLEHNYGQAYKCLSKAKSLNRGNAAYELLSNMMEFIITADMIMSGGKTTGEGVLEDIVGDINNGHRVMELGESFGFIGHKNELLIKRFVRDLYPARIIFPVLAEGVDVMARALERFSVDVEIGYPLETFIYNSEYEVSGMQDSNLSYLHETVRHNVQQNNTQGTEQTGFVENGKINLLRFRAVLSRIMARVNKKLRAQGYDLQIADVEIFGSAFYLSNEGWVDLSIISDIDVNIVLNKETSKKETIINKFKEEFLYFSSEEIETISQAKDENTLLVNLKKDVFEMQLFSCRAGYGMREEYLQSVFNELLITDERAYSYDKRFFQNKSIIFLRLAGYEQWDEYYKKILNKEFNTNDFEAIKTILQSIQREIIQEGNNIITNENIKKVFYFVSPKVFETKIPVNYDQKFIYFANIERAI